MRTSLLASAVLLAAAASCASAEAPKAPETPGETIMLAPSGERRAIPLLTDEARIAFDTLLTTSRFVDGMPCSGADTPDAEQALWVLAREHQASQAFLALLDRAQPAGQLLALCGLLDADAEVFSIEVERFRGVDQTVPVRLGCVEGDVPIGNLIEWTHGPAVRLDDEHPTVDAWFACYPEVAALDIVGGGFTESLREEIYTGMRLGTKEAYNTLVRAPGLIRSPIGYMQRESAYTAALRKLVDDRNVELLVRLCERSPTVAGRLYGLAGLAVCDSDAYAEQAEQFEGQPWTYVSSSGCLSSVLPVGPIVASMHNGEMTRRLLER